jgi:RTX calcium-binding nonapeptide repeat (4 copies)
MTLQNLKIQGSTSGTFSNPNRGTVSGVGSNVFQWGRANPTRSRLKFTSASINVGVSPTFIYGASSFDTGQIFSLGTIEYFNGEITSGTGADNVKLNIKIDGKGSFGGALGLFETTVGGDGSFPFQIDLLSTENGDNPIASADSVFFPKDLPPTVLSSFEVPFLQRRIPLTLEVLGFGNIQGDGFTKTDSFFVLENEAAKADLVGRFTSPILRIIEDAVTVYPSQALNTYLKGIGYTPILPSPGTITATFTPKFGLTLDEAAELCGYDHFAWYQVIVEDSNPYSSRRTGKKFSLPYTDPAIGGYKEYSPGEADDTLPFYFDEKTTPLDSESNLDLEDHISSDRKTLDFSDAPGGEVGNSLKFVTCLVGVLRDKRSFDILNTFSWQSNTIFSQNASKRKVKSGDVFNVVENLSPYNLTSDIRRKMEDDGAKNVSGGAQTPLAPINYSKKTQGVFWAGSKGEDRLVGNVKDDILRGKGGKDRLDGDKGNDRLFGQAGKDILLGGLGQDVLSGGGSNDRITGKNGNDILIGGNGQDLLSGGRGKDSFVFNQLNEGGGKGRHNQCHQNP